MIWYLSNTARYQTEVEAIEALATTESWLEISDWYISDGGRLMCDAEVTVRGRRYPVTLRYNDGFPHTPPSMLSREQELWSTHQYLSGELCLEFGPDNWVSHLTGADMLSSAFRLLDGETPNEAPTEVAPRPVPSRHSLTIGQSLRSSTCRLFYTSAFQDEVASITGVAKATIKYRLQEEAITMSPVSLIQSDGNVWNDPLIPESLYLEGNEWTGLLIKHPQGFSLDGFKTPAKLLQSLFGERPEDVAPCLPDVIMVADDNRIEAIFLSYTDEAIYPLSIVPPSPATRIPPEYEALITKKVGLIGCGSIGSKIASMLARSHLSNFVLVDDDIFQPENLVRNELDWSAVGRHKVDALSRHLQMIRSGLQVDVRRQNLGGQESGTALHGTMTALSTCDLLIDATASGIAFNYISALSVQNTKPVLWVEVLAGGIGGIVARSRTGLEPDPQTARSRILQWCADQNCPAPFISDRAYEGNNTLTSHIADDADVSVMAAHAARMAIDTLIGRTPSCFPYSAYVTGLREGWIFTQPFDTAPIDLGSPLPSTSSSIDKEKARLGALGIVALIEKSIHAESTDTN